VSHRTTVVRAVMTRDPLVDLCRDILLTPYQQFGTGLKPIVKARVGDPVSPASAEPAPDPKARAHRPRHVAGGGL